VITKIRPSGDLVINRTRCNPSAAGTIVKSSGSNNEKGRFRFKRTTCDVSFISGGVWEEHTDGMAARYKIKRGPYAPAEISFHEQNTALKSTF
jgi:hypothetical protein